MAARKKEMQVLELLATLPLSNTFLSLPAFLVLSYSFLSFPSFGGWVEGRTGDTRTYGHKDGWTDRRKSILYDVFLRKKGGTDTQTDIYLILLSYKEIYPMCLSILKLLR